MFFAYRATPITGEYLDVMEQNLGREKFWALKDDIEHLIDADELYYVVYEGYQDPFLGQEAECLFIPFKVLEENWEMAQYDEGIVWVARKKQ